MFIFLVKLFNLKKNEVLICSLMYFSKFGEIFNFLVYVFDFKYKIMKVWYIFL